MDEVMLTCSNSDKHHAKEVKTQIDNLPDLRHQILLLLQSTLSDKSIMMLQEELQLMQRSSYYLLIQRGDLLPTGDQEPLTLHLSDSQLWSLIDYQRLQRTMALASSQVKLLLALLEMIYNEITKGCRELEAFILKGDPGLSDSDLVGSTKQTLQRTQQFVKDFRNRITRNLGPLNVQNQLIPNTGRFPIPELTASLAIKLPVMFDRFESCATSSTVHLCWDITGQQSRESNQQFEIHVKSLHPTTAADCQLTISPHGSCHINICNLIPDRYYQFAVKRLDVVNLVYGKWIDTMVLKTLTISK